MKTLISIILCCLAATIAKAETTESGDSLQGQFSLNTVVVTGTRTPKLLKDTPIQTRVITAEEIRLSDATSIQDLLQQELPGAEFTYAMSQHVNMNLSGFSGQNVLILVDGERLAGENIENPDFSRVNMQDVERIEIIKGAMSALYGSNANGGVINVITRDAQKPLSVNINARLADHKEQRYGGTVGFRSGRFSNTLDVQHTRIDTYTLCLDAKDDCEYRNVFGGRTWNTREKLVFRPDEAMTFTAHAGYFFRERLLDPTVPDHYRDFSGGIRGDWGITQHDNIQISYNFDQYDKSAYNRAKDLDTRNYSNVQHTVRMLYSRQMRQAKDVLTMGTDFMRDYLASYQFSGKARSQQTYDVFAQYDLALSKHWELIGAARWDYFSDGGKSRGTAKAGFRYTARGLTLRGGYSGGFRAPTLKEKYMDYDVLGVFTIQGSPGLKPEKSHNFNASAEYAKGRYNLTLSANYNAVTDKLSYTQPTVDAVNPQLRYVRYINLDRMDVFTLEATAQTRWSLGANSTFGARVGYNYTHEETTGVNINQVCPARPHSAVIKADWDRQFRPWYGCNIALTGRILSAVNYPSVDMEPPFLQYDVRNPAYSLWKVQVLNRFSHGISVSVALDNIFNYAPRTYYLNSPVTLGTNLMVGASLDLDSLF